MTLAHPLPFRLLIFDADGTLRGSTVAGRPPNTQAESVLLPGVVDTLARYDWLSGDWLFGIASNQGGVALGYMTYSQCRSMLQQLAYDVTGLTWTREVVRLCPHAPDAGCLCRKPQPGLLLGLIEYYRRHDDRLRLPQDVLYVGDQPSDWDAAMAAGVSFMWAKDFFGWEATDADGPTGP